MKFIWVWTLKNLLTSFLYCRISLCLLYSVSTYLISFYIEHLIVLCFFRALYGKHCLFVRQLTSVNNPLVLLFLSYHCKKPFFIKWQYWIAMFYAIVKNEVVLYNVLWVVITFNVITPFSFSGIGNIFYITNSKSLFLDPASGNLLGYWRIVLQSWDA